jgi:hypothetical protein
LYFVTVVVAVAVAVEHSTISGILKKKKSCFNVILLYSMLFFFVTLFKSSNSFKKLVNCGSHILIRLALPFGPKRFSSLFNKVCAASLIYENYFIKLKSLK